MKSHVKQRKVFGEGGQAFDDGKSIDDNPYLDNEVLAQQWRMGYYQADGLPGLTYGKIPDDIKEYEN